METGVHDVATLLKEFFRDLPEPLIPKEVQPALLAIQRKYLLDYKSLFYLHSFWRKKIKFFLHQYVAFWVNKKNEIRSILGVRKVGFVASFQFFSLSLSQLVLCFQG